jgi:anti-sigma regulatory factor (Ser/Thr protein kinase)
VCCGHLLERGHLFPLGAPVVATHLDLQPELTSAGLARRFVLANAPRAPSDLRSILAILTSELVTNAVVHARTRIQVGVSTLDGDVVVSVGDEHPAAPKPLPLNDAAIGGRGLALVGALATEWGVEWAHNGEGGKTVWFLLRGSAGHG